MVSPWQKNGTIIEYIKNHSDSQVDYKHLVCSTLTRFISVWLNVGFATQIRGIASGIQVLHAMNPPMVHADIKGVGHKSAAIRICMI